MITIPKSPCISTCVVESFGTLRFWMWIPDSPWNTINSSGRWTHLTYSERKICFCKRTSLEDISRTLAFVQAGKIFQEHQKPAIVGTIPDSPWKIMFFSTKPNSLILTERYAAEKWTRFDDISQTLALVSRWGYLLCTPDTYDYGYDSQFRPGFSPGYHYSEDVKHLFRLSVHNSVQFFMVWTITIQRLHVAFYNSQVTVHFVTQSHDVQS